MNALLVLLLSFHVAASAGPADASPPRLVSQRISRFEVRFVLEDESGAEVIGGTAHDIRDLNVIVNARVDEFALLWRTRQDHKVWRYEALLALVLASYYGLEKAIFQNGITTEDVAVLAGGLGVGAALWAASKLLLDYEEAGIRRDHLTLYQALRDLAPRARGELGPFVKDLRRALGHVRRGRYEACLRALR